MEARDGGSRAARRIDRGWLLTSASCRDDGAIVGAGADAALHADVELAVELHRTVDPRDGVSAARVNGEVRMSASAPRDVAERLHAAARVLAQPAADWRPAI